MGVHTSVASAGVASDRFRTARVSTGSVSAAGAAEVTITWSPAFPDAAYTVVASVEEGTAGSNTLVVRKIISHSATTVVVRVTNDDAVSARTGTINVLALRDGF